MELTERQIYLKIYYLENKENKENKEKKKIYAKKYYQENKEQLSANHKIYNQENKEKVAAQRKIYLQENKQEKALYFKKYYLENKEISKKYYQENKEEKAEYQKIYYQENKEKVNEYRVNYFNSHPIRKLRSRLRSRTNSFFKYKGYKKKTSTEKILGANWKTVESFMEAKFVDGMNWDNIGEWHIDHIIPLSSAETEQEIIKLCHYTNLQPLWAFDNLSKGNKLDWVKE